MPLFARGPRRRQSGLAPITAAAQLVETSKQDKNRTRKKRGEGWQCRAWDMFDQVGEARQAARSVGDVFARVPWFVGVRPDPSGTPIPVDPAKKPDEIEASLPEDFRYTPDEAQEAMDILAELASPLGGQSEIRRQIGVSLFVVGECFLVGEHDDEDDEDPDWNIRSTDELEFDWSQKRTNDAGNEVPATWLREPRGKRIREFPVGTPVIRIWRPHPRAQQWADSPMRSAQEILDELLILTRAIQGAALSRVAGPGILFLPNSMRKLNGPQQADGQASRTDTVVRDILEATQLAISDSSSAAAQAPLVFWVDDTIFEKLVSGNPLVQWDRQVDQIAAAQRSELLSRFANAIDWPAELLTGKAGLNHWVAWLLRDEAFQSNVEPLEILACDAITNSYLRPSLEAAGIEDVDRFCVWYQPVGVVSDPDQGTKALKAHDALLISNDRARRDLGYTDDDEPDAEEYGQRIAVQAFLRNPSLGQLPPIDGQGIPQTRPSSMTLHPVTAALTSGLEDLAPALAELDRSLFAETQQRADATMRRALERANARLRSFALKDPPTRQLVAGIEAHTLLVAPTLGPALVARLTGATDDTPGEDLFAAAFASLLVWYDGRVERVDEELLAMLTAEGLSAVDAEQAVVALGEARDRSGIVLGLGMATLATTLLFAPRPLGPPGETDGFLVPRGTIRDALKAAGGGGHEAVSMMTGDTVGRLWRQTGIEFGEWVWRYGDPASRTHSFDPHRRLNGVRFASWDDDRLGAQAGWPGVSHYAPGDHKGCGCLAELGAPVRIERFAATEMATT